MRRAALALPLLLSGCFDYLFSGGKDDNDGGDSDRPPARDEEDAETDGSDGHSGTDGGGVITDGADGADGSDGTDDPTCDDWAASGAYTVAPDPACMSHTPAYAIAPVLEWSWTSHPTIPGWDNVETNPMVAHLDDDDGDGTIGPGDVPDIVIMSQQGDNYWTGDGAITALDGATGAVKWAMRTASGERFNPASHPAIGDIDADGTPEVCASGWDHAVVCLDGGTGALEWAAGSETDAFGGVAMADMDGDGYGEVTYGRQIFDHQGNTLGVGAGGFGGIDFYGQGTPGSAIADWDGDGVQELVAGNTVYEMDGSTAQDLGGDDTLVAVADLDLDGLPDVVRTGDQYVLVTLNDGSTLWRIPTPGGGLGGPATIVDLDQDGVPEIVVSDFYRLTALEAATGSTIWSISITDESSGALGTAAWDIDRDGYPELIHADQHAWRILDGQTGAILHEDTGHASSTAAEHPVVADVDGDGEAEILVASNDGNFSGWNGLRVYGSGGLGWPPARQVWNQYHYCVTNIEDDGTLPASPVNSWDAWNDVRSAGMSNRRSHWQADLQPGEPELCLDDCDEGLVHVAIPVENEGLVAAGASTAVLVTASGGEVAGVATPGLDAGEAAWLDVVTLDEESWGSGHLTLQLDADGEVDECDEADGSLDLGAWPCAE